MDEIKYRIGEVIKITGISRDTLHFYRKIGLLIPEYTDPDNHYYYYSRWNLWQLDVITMCRKLDVPLEKIKKIFELQDNRLITELLMEYRQEAIRRSLYYKRVADDILWYQKENESISQINSNHDVLLEFMEEQTVIAGSLKEDSRSYHAYLQEASHRELKEYESICRRYGYVLDIAGLKENAFIKTREYLKLLYSDFQYVNPENLWKIPEGNYAVCTVRVHNSSTDFSPLLQWLKKHDFTPDLVVAEERGLQMNNYLSDYFCTIKVHLS